MFQDRRDAGRILARALTSYRGTPGLLVLGLARGGIPVGWEVAAHLRAPLDVLLVRKLGVPSWPELAMGALVADSVVLDSAMIQRLGIDEQQVDDVIDRERAELTRRTRRYRGDRPRPDVSGRTVIVVDDGMATGASMVAAVRSVADAAHLVVAVPVAPPSVCRDLAREVDRVVCISSPPRFEAVGQAFADFRQITDDEVCALLATPTV